MNNFDVKDFNTESMLIEADNLYKQEKYLDAENLINTVINNDSKNHKALFGLSIIKYQNGLNYEAKILLKRAIDLFPDEIYLHNLAAILNEEGYLSDAFQICLEILRNNPTHILNLKNCASILYKINDFKNAKILYEKILQISPNDEESIIFLNIVNNENNLQLSNNYIANLFDSYANNFEKHLKTNLKYTIPDKIGNIINKYHSYLEYNLELKILDLGCGTGLVGECLTRINNNINYNICGVDLSKNMLSMLKDKKIYKKIVQQDIKNFIVKERKKYHIITAADVFVYIGELEEIFFNTKRLLSNNGLFLFSIENSIKNDNYYIDKNNLRYKHNNDYINLLISKNNFKIIQITDEIIRYNNHQPVEGKIYVLSN